MSQDANFAETYKSIVDAEKQALMLEAMLDRLDGKLDHLLEEIGETNGTQESGEKAENAKNDAQTE